MEQFLSKARDDYHSVDGFHHELLFPRHGKTAIDNKIKITCMACTRSRVYTYSEKHTQENELIAVEAAHWQMTHRETCIIPIGALKIN